MTLIAHIVEKFVMEIEEPEEGHDEWFLDWVLRSPKQAGRHLTAGWLSLNRLKEVYRGDEIQTCNEWFGGMGAQALMADRLFNLRSHWVGEYTQVAVDHLSNALPKRTDVFMRDAYDFSGQYEGAFDLQIMDFGDLTVRKTEPDYPHRQLLDRVFETQPRAVLLTDIAARYLHLHVDGYESILGEGSCGSYEEYLIALQRRLERLYGYVPAATFYDRWSTVMALVPRGLAPWGELTPTPASPVGLEIL